MVEIGRICIKTKGREAGKKAVIVDLVNDKFVLIDGNVKRRKCNLNHVKLLPEKINIEKGMSTADIKKIFDEKGILEKIEISVKEKRPRKKGEKPRKERPRKKKEVKESKKKKQTEDELVEQALEAAEKK